MKGCALRREMDRHFGWHFLQTDRCLQWNAEKPLEVSDELHIELPLEILRRGLHWCKRPIDALTYAPGSVVCYVEVWGETQFDSDIGVSEYRRITWMHDAELLLWQYACDIIEDALLLANVVEPASWAAVELRREWLEGCNVVLDQWHAVQSAAHVAVQVAPRHTAQHAAQHASWVATWENSWRAAESITRDAAWVAVESAVESADRSTAWHTARSAENDRLGALLVAQMRRDGVLQRHEES